jgi:hypothetical protein
MNPITIAPLNPTVLVQPLTKIWGLFLGCPDLDAAYEELLGKGVTAKKPVVTWCGMKQMYLRDPDGYGLCFQWSAIPLLTLCQPWFSTSVGVVNPARASVAACCAMMPHHGDSGNRDKRQNSLAISHG